MRKRIFGLLKEKGIDEDLRHDIQLSIVGKGSLKEFTESDGRALIEHLEGSKRKPKTKGPQRGDSPIRKKYRGDDGLLQVFVKPTISQAQIRKLYAMMRELIDAELEAFGLGLMERPADWSDDAGKRLDGWAKFHTNGDAERVSELMKWEAVRLIELVKNQAFDINGKIWQHKHPKEEPAAP